jgi:hypothetical protein
MTELTVALLILLVSRVIFLREKPLSRKQAVQKSLLETAAVLLLYSWANVAIPVLLVFLWGINLAHAFAEERAKRVNEEFRLCLLPVMLGLFVIALSPAIGIELADHALNMVRATGGYLLLPPVFFTPGALAIVAGLMLCGRESNLAIRVLLGNLGLRPEQENVIEPSTYKNGRTIGTLERVLILIFVSLDQFTAIAFILAAKGFTRFKELENRPFAEYVLIGTLASFTLALGIAFLIRLL